MSKTKTVYLLILALSFLAIVSLPTGIFGYDSTQECFYEELTNVVEVMIVANPLLLTVEKNTAR